MTPPVDRWSDDAFLDTLRRVGDPPADATVAALAADGGEKAVGTIFKLLRANDTPLPPDAPRAAHGRSWRLRRVCRRPRPARDSPAAARPSCATPCRRSWCCSPRACRAATRRRASARSCRSRGPRAAPLRPADGRRAAAASTSRTRDAFQPAGRAIVTAQKLRLLHAGVRAIAARYRPHYQARFGAPVNHEDMLATIMGFSYLLIDGIRRLKLPLPTQEAEDLYYLWRVFALLMGIHPDGRPHDDELHPGDDRRRRRRSTTPTSGATTPPPTATALRRRADAGQPDDDDDDDPAWPLRLFGLGFAPRICMTELMTPEELARVGVTPLVGHNVVKAFLGLLLRLGRDVGGHTSFAVAARPPAPARHGRRRPARRSPVLHPLLAATTCAGPGSSDPTTGDDADDRRHRLDQLEGLHRPRVLLLRRSARSCG